jgi:hypothetical protein
MSERGSFSVRAKCLLLSFSVCAFLAIFSSVDTAEQYRAWTAANRWTREQKVTATALDSERMHSLALVALAVDTAIIAVSFAGGLTLGVAVATENLRTLMASSVMGAAVTGMGVLYSGLMIVYRFLIGERKVLKGPIF